MRKKRTKKKYNQKQKQSQNVKQTVNVNLGNVTKRRPQRRSGTRTAPLVTYQNMPIPLAPSIDFGKLEHTISSLQNNILHSINNREHNNLISTPPIQTPEPKTNLMSGLQAAQRDEEKRQETDDKEFSSFLQGKETVNESSFRKMKKQVFDGSPPQSERTAGSSALNQVRRDLFRETPARSEAIDAILDMKDAMRGLPLAESRRAGPGRPRGDTQRATPVGGFIEHNSTDPISPLTPPPAEASAAEEPEPRRKRRGRPRNEPITFKPIKKENVKDFFSPRK